MAYDERLADRVRAILGNRPDYSERAMFGGLCCLLGGHMAAGIVGPVLMLRVGPEASGRALTRRHVRPMDFTGRPLAGMIYVDPPGIRTAAALRVWLAMAVAFVETLPAKPAAKKRQRPRCRA